ncbi:uncharacterized protein PAC_07551 [Phialocephala subalpina]|uniref:Uncharacterized protein n=1 Tax=Phialocephala subalpina TaxID=576137 RepID=A0A1L7WY20_9HELO|nr:uncharacterized protein PAC_07551 [Phialocephala subalpina]
MPVLLVPGVHDYRITRGLDLSLQFDPPIGSLELANALSYRYPMEQNLESKMRRAILDHLDTEHQPNPELSPGATSADPTSSTSAGIRTGSMDSNANTTWNIATGKPLEKKRKKSAYSETKRKKVAGPSLTYIQKCTHYLSDDKTTTNQELDINTKATTAQLGKSTSDTSPPPVLEISHQGTDALSSLFSSLDVPTVNPNLDIDWLNYTSDDWSDFLHYSQDTTASA